MKTTFLFLFGGIILNTSVPLSAQTQPPVVLDENFLAQLRTEAVTKHPALDAAQARVDAAGEATRALRRWDDPMVGISLMAAEKAMRQDDGDFSVGYEQNLPRRRLFEAQTKQAEAIKAVRAAEKETSSLALASEAVRIALELAWTDESLVLEGAYIEWLAHMTEVARAQTVNPGANASESLRLEAVVIARRAAREISLVERVGLAERLNLLLGRPHETPWPALAFPASPPPPPDPAATLARLEADNPMLRALALEITAAQAAVRVAERTSDPVVSIFADARAYSGGDFREATVGVKVTLPWFNDSAYAADRARARHERTATESTRVAEARRLRGEVVAALASSQARARQAELFIREVRPSAIRAATVAENAWTSGQITLLEVLEARKAVLETEIEKRRLVATQIGALETLRSLVPPPADKNQSTK